MIMEYVTKRDRNGNYKYLSFDTDKKIYSTNNPHFMATDAITVKTSDLKRIITTLSDNNFVRVEYIR